VRDLGYGVELTIGTKDVAMNREYNWVAKEPIEPREIGVKSINNLTFSTACQNIKINVVLD